MISADSTSPRWHSMPVEEVVQSLNTDLTKGLSSREALARLDQYGPNAVTKARGRSRLVMFLSQFSNPLVVVLLFAVLITFLLNDYVDAGVILAVVFVNAIIGFIQEGKAESAIESLSKLLIVEATVVRDGSTVRIPSDRLVPGDIVVLASGDKVPADIRLVEEKNLQTNESILTGESAPVNKSAAPVHADESVSDRTCMVYSGTLVTAGTGKGIVVATGDNTEMGRISGLISSAPSIVTPLTQKLARFGRWLSAVIIGIAFLVFGIGVFLQQKPAEMFNAAVAIAVAMIPEGLPAIVTIILAVGVKRMADRNAIIRNLPSVETLGSVTVICSDKTGTLTANEMTVRIVYAGNDNYEFGGIGYDPASCCVVPSDTDDTELQSEAFIETIRCGLICNDSDLQHENDTWSPVGDPTEVALITAAMKSGLNPNEERAKYPRVDVIPFESDKMYMATLNSTPHGTNVIYVKGSTERILAMCCKQLFADGERPLDARSILARADDLAAQGYRLLSFAMKVVPASVTSLGEIDLSDLVYLGLQAMSDPPRPEAVEAVQKCKDAGIEVKMITGDHLATATAIAREMRIGSRDVKAVSGSELASMSDAEFDRIAQEASVFARVSPEQKYHLVEVLQAQDNIVAMTGDGVNDAPALKKADIGVAMGKAGSDVAKDAADMVLADDNFASIVAAIEEGRTVFSNLVKTLAYILPTNIGEGLVIIVALLGGLLLPVTPVQLLWVNTVTAVTLALPFAFEPKEPGLMKRPPRRPDAPILTGSLILRIALVGVVVVLGTFVIFLYERSIGVGVAEARTAAVATIVMFEVFYLFSARSEQGIPWRIPLGGNPYLWIGIFLVVLFQLGFTYLPLLNHFFGSSPIKWSVWWRIIAVTLLIIPVVEVEKSIRLRLTNR